MGWLRLAAFLLCASSSDDAPADAWLSSTLADAPLVVRGRLRDPYVWTGPERPGASVYLKLDVSEWLKGRSENPVLVRQPAEGEGNRDAMELGGEMILLLGERDASDGSRDVLGYPAGRYRVSGLDAGGAVLVNASGVDADYVSAKDKRPSAPNVEMPLSRFRALAAGRAPPEAKPAEVSPAPVAPPARAVSLPPPDAPHLAAPAPPESASPPASGFSPWQAAAVAAALLVALALGRALSRARRGR